MGENTEAKKDTGLLIVQSKVRDLIREKEMRTSDELISALSEHVRTAVENPSVAAQSTRCPGTNQRPALSRRQMSGLRLASITSENRPRDNPAKAQKSST